jgi:CubicO group peptidase (beta-lactamase class C family)
MSARLAVAVAFLSLPGLASAQSLDRATIEALDRAIAAYVKEQGIPGLTAAVALEGRVVWSRGYGLADLENSVPATPDTVYRSASIGKPMTATAAMRLVELGKLDVEQPIQRYCPAFPVKAWPITVRQLLTHTSGIRHYGGPRDQEEQTSTVH